MEEAIIIIPCMLMIGLGLIRLFVLYIIDSKYEKEKQRLDKERSEIRTFYICNRKKCNNCSSECHHCSDIEHAKNFEKIGKVYFEKDYTGGKNHE